MCFYSIWDWGTGAKIMYCQSRGTKGGTKLTALEWVNGHDVALLMVASDDGTVKLWRPTNSLHTREPVLVSAWHALSDMVSNSRTNSKCSVFYYNVTFVTYHSKCASF